MLANTGRRFRHRGRAGRRAATAEYAGRRPGPGRQLRQAGRQPGPLLAARAAAAVAGRAPAHGHPRAGSSRPAALPDVHAHRPAAHPAGPTAGRLRPHARPQRRLPPARADVRRRRRAADRAAVPGRPGRARRHRRAADPEPADRHSACWRRPATRRTPSSRGSTHWASRCRGRPPPSRRCATTRPAPARPRRRSPRLASRPCCRSRTRCATRSRPARTPPDPGCGSAWPAGRRRPRPPRPRRRRSTASAGPRKSTSGCAGHRTPTRRASRCRTSTRCSASTRTRSADLQQLLDYARGAGGGDSLTLALLYPLSPATAAGPALRSDPVDPAGVLLVKANLSTQSNPPAAASAALRALAMPQDGAAVTARHDVPGRRPRLPHPALGGGRHEHRRLLPVLPGRPGRQRPARQPLQPGPHRDGQPSVTAFPPTAAAAPRSRCGRSTTPPWSPTTSPTRTPRCSRCRSSCRCRPSPATLAGLAASLASRCSRSARPT